jgi:hypothetical protein
LDNTPPEINNEIINRPPRQQLIELRKYAIEQGVAPGQVDNYLLGQQWISDEVKVLIRGQVENATNPATNQNIASEGNLEPNMDMESVPQPQNQIEASQPGQPGQSVVEQTGAVSAPDEGVSGSVELINSKQEMQRIRQEVDAEGIGQSYQEQALQPTGREGQPDMQRETMQERGDVVQEQNQPSQEVQPQQQADQLDDQAASRQESEIDIQEQFDGHPVSDTVANNPQKRTEIAANGSPKDTETWQAALVDRLVNMWNTLVS